MLRGKAQVLKRFSAQEHDKYTTVPVSAFCGMFHLQNIFECTCVRYNFVLFALFFSLMS